MTENFHKRCPTCEELRIGFTYRTLINGLCRVHALESASGSFVKLTYQGNACEHSIYGWLRYYRAGKEVHTIKFARTPTDAGRIFSRSIYLHNVVAIEVMTEAEYVHMLVESGGLCVVQHFGHKHAGRIVQSARTRVLVRFFGRGGGCYERWKPVYAVQPNAF